MARIQRRIIPKKGLNDLDNHDGVVIRPEPDIMDCEVRWALGSITINKASGGDRIPENSKKKAFLSDQCKEIEENNRMGKTRNLKKIGDMKGKFHTRMGTIKDRNGKDLKEEIKKRWQEYTEELYKKGLNDLYNHDGVVTHLESDILECGTLLLSV